MFFLFRLKSLKELVEKLPALSRLIKMQALLEWLQLLLLKHSISISIDTPSLNLPLNTEVKFLRFSMWAYWYSLLPGERLQALATNLLI